MEPGDHRTELDRLVAGADPAMVVVTAAAGARTAGCLVGFHSQSSIDPWRYDVHLSKADHTYRVACRASHLLVHFLGREHRRLARTFGELTDDATGVRKLAAARWTPGPDGATPLLAGVERWFLGRTVARHHGRGDHAAFVLDPVWAQAPGGPHRPLRLGDVEDLTAGHPAPARRSATGRLRAAGRRPSPTR